MRTVSARVRTTSTGFRRRRPGWDENGKPEEEIDVAREGGGDPWPQDLDRDVLAAGRDGEMDLRDRRGGNRLVVEAGEDGRERLAKLGLDDAAGDRAGKGRQAVLQLRHVGGEFLAEQIGARRQQLAELDEARAERVQRGGEALTRPRGGKRVARAQQAKDGEQRQQHGDAVEHEERVVARQDQADLDQPGKVAAGAQESEHLEPSYFSSPLAGEEGAHRGAMGR